MSEVAHAYTLGYVFRNKKDNTYYDGKSPEGTPYLTSAFVMNEDTIRILLLASASSGLDLSDVEILEVRTFREVARDATDRFVDALLRPEDAPDALEGLLSRLQSQPNSGL